jgi:flagellar motor switch protein FliN/FliY
MADEEVNIAQNQNDQGDESEEELSWDDVKEDLEKQKEMINEPDMTEKQPLQELQQQQPPPQPPPSTGETSLDLILDIPLHITIELGRTRMTIQELLQLGQGSIIELNKVAGEPMEVFVSEKLVARGEVVRINEKLGIRLIDIVTPQERIENLV